MVNLESKGAKSVLTNSARLANITETSACINSEDVMREMGKEIKGDGWERDERGFEQHLLEEDRVRVDWKSGKFPRIYVGAPDPRGPVLVPALPFRSFKLAPVLALLGSLTV